ncbi:DNA mismatch repair protein MutT [Phenylobacterium sp. Root77]|jgi:8-oxo-dGTP pyrophosphatase MutT (NUDIX family)|uniref:NUDIX domain-containing protein n=1 Tax=unclassified Phenylobacterium TaxID=2640670 RepID=UPI0006F59BCE|nr:MULTISPECIES: NUDIX hydrolase [unclassified Phenylobacterium]KQW70329.1 DNA mismatch repair protein MutT [Phenylobacterium sp. Root1277]KQW91250.1 DNA mismatch repair protein MutT [Phenylobacterium sp. Root1290]KRC39113.1 DNA mismatch repair protein MutT [Phenylobacterium sp. Root77]
MSQKPAWLTEHGKPWLRGDSKVAYENPWITITEHDATAPTGAAAFYGVVGFKNYALAVLPIDADGAVVLVGQHRFPFADYSWEIPEGGGPKSEDPLAGAQRELAEEAGLAAGDWQEVLRVQLSNSVTDELAIGYLATDLKPAPEVRHADDTEDIAIVRVPFREALAAATEGHIRDALTVAMLLRAYHMAREGLLSASLARAMLG